MAAPWDSFPSIFPPERALAFEFQLYVIWRWVLRSAALVGVIKALVGWLGKLPFSRLDDGLGMVLTTILG